MTVTLNFGRIINLSVSYLLKYHIIINSKRSKFPIALITRNRVNNSKLFYLLGSFSLPLSITNWFYKNDSNPNLRYWKTNNIQDIINEADQLYSEQKFVESYTLLNRIKFSNHEEILWRITRNLYKLATSSDVPYKIKQNMVNEAIDLMKIALTIADDNAIVHKWTAIILDLKFNMEGIKAKINGLQDIKYHITRAVELDSSQTTLLFMLGKLSYDLANLTWFQKKLANVLFAEIPDGSFESAYKYFLKAEQNSPCFYIGNLVMLGKTSMKLNKLHRARYYFNLATQIAVNNPEDKKLQEEAAQLEKTLSQYNISQLVFD